VRTRLFLIAVLCSFFGLYADAIDNLKPGEWYEVPGTPLSAVKPSPEPPGATGFRSVMDAWSGGAFDSKRDRMILWGGGHTDYAGNEIYVFDLHTMQWSRIWGPTPSAQIPSGGNFETYSDGNPGSRHTYGGLTYVPDPVDALWACSGALWQGGGGSIGTWEFKFGTNAWERKADFPDNNAGWQACGYDSARAAVIVEGMYWACEFNPQNNTWTKRYNNGAGWWNGYVLGDVDPKRRILVRLGNGELQSYNLDTYANTDKAATCTGATGIISARAPGLAYDPVSDRMVAWNGGTSVYTLNTATWSWTLVPPAATNTVDPGSPNGSGTYGRWRYIPSRNVFFVVNGVDQNVFLYRLTSGTGAMVETRPTNSAGFTMSVSPCPVRTSAAIRLDGFGAAKPVAMKIYDLQGRAVLDLSGKVDGSGRVLWKPAGFSNGVYLIKAQVGSRQITIKVLYQK
jgi:hypothetical protein